MTSEKVLTEVSAAVSELDDEMASMQSRPGEKTVLVRDFITDEWSTLRGWVSETGHGELVNALRAGDIRAALGIAFNHGQERGIRLVGFRPEAHRGLRDAEDTAEFEGFRRRMSTNQKAHKIIADETHRARAIAFDRPRERLDGARTALAEAEAWLIKAEGRPDEAEAQAARNNAMELVRKRLAEIPDAEAFISHLAPRAEMMRRLRKAGVPKGQAESDVFPTWWPRAKPGRKPKT